MVPVGPSLGTLSVTDTINMLKKTKMRYDATNTLAKKLVVKMKIPNGGIPSKSVEKINPPLKKKKKKRNRVNEKQKHVFHKLYIHFLLINLLGHH